MDLARTTKTCGCSFLKVKKTHPGRRSSRQCSRHGQPSQSEEHLPLRKEKNREIRMNLQKVCWETNTMIHMDFKMENSIGFFFSTTLSPKSKKSFRTRWIGEINALEISRHRRAKEKFQILKIAHAFSDVMRTCPDSGRSSKIYCVGKQMK